MREEHRENTQRESNRHRQSLSTKDKILLFIKRFGIIIAFGIAAVSAVFVLISQQSKLDEVNKRNEELQAQMAALEDEAGDLEAELEHAGSDEYSEDAARDKLGWVKDDELVFKESDTSSDNKEDGK